MDIPSSNIYIGYIVYYFPSEALRAGCAMTWHINTNHSINVHDFMSVPNNQENVITRTIGLLNGTFC